MKEIKKQTNTDNDVIRRGGCSSDYNVWYRKRKKVLEITKFLIMLYIYTAPFAYAKFICIIIINVSLAFFNDNYYKLNALDSQSMNEKL